MLPEAQTLPTGWYGLFNDLKGPGVQAAVNQSQWEAHREREDGTPESKGGKTNRKYVYFL